MNTLVLTSHLGNAALPAAHPLPSLALEVNHCPGFFYHPFPFLKKLIVLLQIYISINDILLFMFNFIQKELFCMILQYTVALQYFEIHRVDTCKIVLRSFTLLHSIPLCDYIICPFHC